MREEERGSHGGEGEERESHGGGGSVQLNSYWLENVWGKQLVGTNFASISCKSLVHQLFLPAIPIIAELQGFQGIVVVRINAA